MTPKDFKEAIDDIFALSPFVGHQKTHENIMAAMKQAYNAGLERGAEIANKEYISPDYPEDDIEWNQAVEAIISEIRKEIKE